MVIMQKLRQKQVEGKMALVEQRRLKTRLEGQAGPRRHIPQNLLEELRTRNHTQ